MSSATARVTRRQVCETHGLEWGQVQVPGVAGQESRWLPICCRLCEKDLQREAAAAEEMAARVAEITDEVASRIAADPTHEQNIREAADDDLAREAQALVANFYAENREAWEKYHRDRLWNEKVAKVEAEKKSALLFDLKKQEKE